MHRPTWALLAVLLLTAPLAAEAQPGERIYRVGYLATGRSTPEGSPLREAFREALRDLGYVEGRNLVITWAGAEGRPERIPGLVADLIRSRVDVIVSSNDATHFAAKKATAEIPIVMLISHDPVGDGLVASLARPGGNVTGLSSMLLNLEAKQMELLRDAVPGLARVGLLYRPGDTPISAGALKRVQDAAAQLGLAVLRFEVREPSDLEAVFAMIANARPDALRIGFQPFTFRHRQRIMELAGRLGIPTMTGSRQFVRAGGLMSYGINMRDVWRRGAHYSIGS